MLWPVQAFCRVAAVGGALQVLRCAVEGPIFDEHSFSCIGVELGSGQVSCRQAWDGMLAKGLLDRGSLSSHACSRVLARPRQKQGWSVRRAQDAHVES